jgi:2-polyprenyl-6-methoxyphenol hydroxylase-like FAD-dependent oxidoreductase
MDVILAGGGIGGLAAALSLHQVGIRCRVYAAAQEYNRVGVGINLQPHAVKVLSKLGLQAALLQRAVVVEERTFFNAHGQLILSEPELARTMQEDMARNSELIKRIGASAQ